MYLVFSKLGVYFIFFNLNSLIFIFLPFTDTNLSLNLDKIYNNNNKCVAFNYNDCIIFYLEKLMFDHMYFCLHFFNRYENS